MKRLGARLLVFCARTLAYLGIWVSARRVAHAAVRVDGSFAWAHQQYALISEIVQKCGLAHQSPQQWARVADHYRKAARLDRKRRHLFLSSGIAYEKAGDLAAACDTYEEGLKAMPSHHKMRYRLGLNLGIKGESGAAKELVRRALAEAGDAKTIDWHYNLARLENQNPGPSGWATDLRALLAGPGVAVVRSESDVLLESGAPEAKLRDSFAASASLSEGSSPDWWIFVYALSMLRSDFHAAVDAKNAAAELVLRAADREIRTHRQAEIAVAAALWLGDLERADGVLQRARAALNGSDGLTELEASIFLQRGDLASFRRLWGSRTVGFAPPDRRFARAVEKSTLSVVCPAQTGLRSGEQIDAADLVVRTNFHSSDRIKAQQEYLGSRTHVSYYNKEHFLSNSRKIIGDVRTEGLRFAVGRSRYFSFLRRPMRTPTRVYYPFTGIFFGRGYALPHMLHDLLIFNPGEIGVFNVDFFLGESSHFAGYYTKGVDVRESYLLHCPLGSFGFLKNLLAHGLFRPDPVLRELLSLSRAEFTARLAERCRA